jgi:hypothetical protein
MMFITPYMCSNRGMIFNSECAVKVFPLMDQPSTTAPLPQLPPLISSTSNNHSNSLSNANQQHDDPNQVTVSSHDGDSGAAKPNNATGIGVHSQSSLTSASSSTSSSSSASTTDIPGSVSVIQNSTSSSTSITALSQSVSLSLQHHQHTPLALSSSGGLLSSTLSSSMPSSSGSGSEVSMSALALSPSLQLFPSSPGFGAMLTGMPLDIASPALTLTTSHQAPPSPLLLPTYHQQQHQHLQTGLMAPTLLATSSTRVPLLLPSSGLSSTLSSQSMASSSSNNATLAYTSGVISIGETDDGAGATLTHPEMSSSRSYGKSGKHKRARHNNNTNDHNDDIRVISSQQMAPTPTTTPSTSSATVGGGPTATATPAVGATSNSSTDGSDNPLTAISSPWVASSNKIDVTVIDVDHRRDNTTVGHTPVLSTTASSMSNQPNLIVAPPDLTPLPLPIVKQELPSSHTNTTSVSSTSVVLVDEEKGMAYYIAEQLSLTRDRDGVDEASLTRRWHLLPFQSKMAFVQLASLRAPRRARPSNPPILHK